MCVCVCLTPARGRFSPLGRKDEELRSPLFRLPSWNARGVVFRGSEKGGFEGAEACCSIRGVEGVEGECV